MGERKQYKPYIKINGELRELKDAVPLGMPPSFTWSRERSEAKLREQYRRDCMIQEWLLPVALERSNR